MKQSKIKRIAGILNSVEEIGVYGDLRIVIGKKNFYKLSWVGDNPRFREDYKRVLEKNLGESTIILYERERRDLATFVAEKLFFFNFKTPITCRSIKDIFIKGLKIEDYIKQEV